jgi:hypothetical protein
MAYPSQNEEDIFIFNNFFKDHEVKRDGVFLEMGALDGFEFANSIFYEQCLG